MALFLEKDEDGDVKDFHWVRALLAVIVVAWTITAISFGLEIATAGIVGRGEAYIQKESAGNRIASQQRFAQALGAIVMYNQQYIDGLADIDAWDQANSGKPDNALGTLAKQRSDLVQSANGTQRMCQDAIRDYNVAGQSYLAEDFKSEGLPDTVQTSQFCQGDPIDLAKYPGLAQFGAN